MKQPTRRSFLQAAAGVGRRALGRHEDVVPRYAAVGEATADLALVAVDRRGVEVAVAGLEGDRCRAHGVLALDLPGAEAEQRHARAVRQRR